MKKPTPNKTKKGNPYDINYQMETYNLSKEEAEEKINQLKTKLKKANPYDINYQMEKYNLTKEEAETKIDQLKTKLKQRNPCDINYQMEKYNLTKEEAEEKIKLLKVKKSGSYNVNYQMEKYNLTKEEAEEKIKLLKSKTGSSFNIKYQMKKQNINEDEAIELINKRKEKISKSVKSALTIEKMGELNFKAMSPKNKEHWIKKGFEEEVAIQLAKDQCNHMRSFYQEYLKINPEKYKNGFTTKIDYWLFNGFSEEEAKVKLKERQTTFTRAKCIEKYGQEEGIKIWRQRQEKWQNTLKSKPQEEIDRINKLKRVNLESFIRKYGDEIGPIKYELYRDNKAFLLKQYSKIATQLFNEAIDKFQLPINEVFLNENEFYITCNTRKRKFFYDFKFNNKIIEFNGDFWHMNPNIYKPDDINNITKFTAQEKWDFDENKIELAKENGYDVLVIWESEYRKDPTTVLNKINAFLNLGD